MNTGMPNQEAATGTHYISVARAEALRLTTGLNHHIFIHAGLCFINEVLITNSSGEDTYMGYEVGLTGRTYDTVFGPTELALATAPRIARLITRAYDGLCWIRLPGSSSSDVMQ